MRRWAFYLSVALLAFGIGSFLAISFYWTGSLKIAVEETNTEIKPIEQIKTDKLPKAEFSCEDEATKTVWEKLEKDENFIKWTNFAIESHRINNCQELFVRQSVDLNKEKPNEIILKGNRPLFCGSGGDCKTWIVSKINNKYRIIFEAFAGEDSDSLQFLSKKTHEFKEIKIKRNNGWEADSFGFFNFDGKQYRIKKCFKDINSEYEFDDIYDEKLISVKLNNCL